MQFIFIRADTVLVVSEHLAVHLNFSVSLWRDLGNTHVNLRCSYILAMLVCKSLQVHLKDFFLEVIVGFCGVSI